MTASKQKKPKLSTNPFEHYWTSTELCYMSRSCPVVWCQCIRRTFESALRPEFQAKHGFRPPDWKLPRERKFSLPPMSTVANVAKYTQTQHHDKSCENLEMRRSCTSSHSQVLQCFLRIIECGAESDAWEQRKDLHHSGQFWLVETYKAMSMWSWNPWTQMPAPKARENKSTGDELSLQELSHLCWSTGWGENFSQAGTNILKHLLCSTWFNCGPCFFRSLTRGILACQNGQCCHLVDLHAFTPICQCFCWRGLTKHCLPQTSTQIDAASEATNQRAIEE